MREFWLILCVLLCRGGPAAAGEIPVGESGLNVRDGIYVYGGIQRVQALGGPISGLRITVAPAQKRIFVAHFLVTGVPSLRKYLLEVIQNGGSVVPPDGNFKERYFCHSYDRYCRELQPRSDMDLSSRQLIPVPDGVILPHHGSETWVLVPDPRVLEAGYRARAVSEARSLVDVADEARATLIAARAELPDCIVRVGRGQDPRSVLGFDYGCVRSLFAATRSRVTALASNGSEERDLLLAALTPEGRCPAGAWSGPGYLSYIVQIDCIQTELSRSQAWAEEVIGLLKEYPAGAQRPPR
jgi:hypothetical protein